MPPRSSAQPEFIEVNRSELRQNQSSLLKKAKGRTVLEFSGTAAQEASVWRR